MSLPSFELSAAGDVKEAQEASFQHIHDVELAIPQTNTDFVEGFSSTAFPSCHDALRRDVRATFRARSREVGDPVSITLDRIDRLYDSWVFRGTRRLSGREKRVVSGWHRDGDKYAVISDSGYGYELPYFALSESMRQLSSL